MAHDDYIECMVRGEIIWRRVQINGQRWGDKCESGDVAIDRKAHSAAFTLDINVRFRHPIPRTVQNGTSHTAVFAVNVIYAPSSRSTFSSNPHRRLLLVPNHYRTLDDPFTFLPGFFVASDMLQAASGFVPNAPVKVKLEAIWFADPFSVGIFECRAWVSGEKSGLKVTTGF